MKPEPELNMTDYGKMPPAHRELEEAVLGAVMIEDKAFGKIASLINTEQAFYVDAHSLIFNACKKLYTQNKPIDLLTVTEQLKADGNLDRAGGPFFITQLTNKIGSSANIEYHARLIVEAWIKRRLISDCSSIIAMGYEDTTDVFDLLAIANNRINAINKQLHTQQTISFETRVYDTAEELENASKLEGHITGIPSFSKNLDSLTAGFQNGELIILAGRPGMSKTSVALHCALQQAKAGIKPAFFSLEVKDRALIKKMFASWLKMNMKHVVNGRLTDKEWQLFNQAVTAIAALPFYLDDTAGLTLNQLMVKLRTEVQENGAKIAYIDHLGLISTADSGQRFATRQLEIGYITRALKALSKELNIPIIVLSQLSREPEKRTGLDKRPRLSDLREAGDIEQDADLVIMLFRPAYYKIEIDEDGNKFPDGWLELDLAKFRNGQPDPTVWIFNPPHSSFTDYTEEKPMDAVEKQMNAKGFTRINYDESERGENNDELIPF